MHITTLPFVNTSKSTGKVNFWSPDESGDYAVQCSRGRHYAVALLDYMHETNNPNMLRSVTMAMPPSDMQTGVEVGFFTQIAMRAAGLTQTTKALLAEGV